MNQKPNILSIEDTEKVYDLINLDDEWREALSLLKDIEKRYDIDDMSFEDNRFATGVDRYPAAVANLKLLVYINYLDFDFEDEDSFEFEDFSEAISKYGERRIKKIEKKIKSHKKLEADKLELLSFQIIHLTSILATIYLDQDDFKKIAKIYYKYIKYLYSCSQDNIAWIYEEYWHLDKEDTSYLYGDEINDQDVKRLLLYPTIFRNSLNDFFKEYLYDTSDKKVDIFVDNPRLLSCFVQAINYAEDNEPCLIIGETGTGKESIARIIHYFSERKENNFVAVNCGGFTESLFNSEVCGIIKGAATDTQTRLGAFLKTCGREENGKTVSGYCIDRKKEKELDKIQFKKNRVTIQGDPSIEDLTEFGGTLFLDEVNSLPSALQAKLLRIIQEREVQVVGEDKTRKFNIKIICATNKDINSNEPADQFRKDLYYRISRGIIKLPPLREMKESIIDIAKYMIKEFSKIIIPDENVSLSKKAADKLKSYNWPGNIRELENVLYRALKNMILEGDKKLKPHHIENLYNRKETSNELEKFFSGKTLPEIEKLYVEYILKETNNNKTKAAIKAGFGSRSRIRTLSDKYNIST